MEALVAWITTKLGGVLGIIAGAFAREILQAITAFFKKQAAQKASDEAIDKKAAESVQKEDDAKTPDEMDRADADVLSGR